MSRRRGRPSWVTGTKFTFLDRYADEWQKATDGGLAEAGKFYTRITKHFIRKYGWHFDRWSDKQCPDPDPATIDEDEPQDGLASDEVVARNEYFRKLHGLIMAWFLAYYAKVNPDTAHEVEKMFAEMSEAVPKPPRRMRITQFYSKHYYNARIKSVFDAEWAAKTSDSSRISILNSVTNRLWAAEPQSFKTWLEGRRDEEHQKELEEHQKLVKEMEKPPDSPESYHSALSHAAIYLQPFADLMARKFGAAVSILMVCPVGTSQGEIELRSVHSGVTKEVFPKTWPVFDRPGFDLVQKSMINFGRHVFSTSEMEARSLGPRSGTTSSNTPSLSQSPAGEESTQTAPPLSEVPSGTTLPSSLDGGFLPPVAPRPNESFLPPNTSRRDELASPTSIPSCDGPPLPLETFPRNDPSPTRDDSSPSGIPNREDSPPSRSTPRNESPLPPGTPSRNESSPSGIPNHKDSPPGAPSSDESPSAIPNRENPPPSRSTARNESASPPDTPFSAKSPPAIPNREDPPPSRSTPRNEPASSPDAPSSDESSPAGIPNDGDPLHSRSTRGESPLPPGTSSCDKSLASPRHASPLSSELQGRLAILDDVPVYSKAIYEAVLRDALKWGAAWADCVVAFVTFEKIAGFGLQDMRLPSLSSRPSQMGEWFKYGRKLSGQVWEGFCQGDADAFGECWGKWWSDLQPEGRRRDDRGMFLKDDVDVDWRCLRKPGGNGVFLILVTLVWWREMIDVQGLQPSKTKNWQDSVEDVRWVLGCLMDGQESTGNQSSLKQQKRKATSDMGPPKNTRTRC